MRTASAVLGKKRAPRGDVVHRPAARRRRPSGRQKTALRLPFPRPLDFVAASATMNHIAASGYSLPRTKWQSSWSGSVGMRYYSSKATLPRLNRSTINPTTASGIAAAASSAIRSLRAKLLGQYRSLPGALETLPIDEQQHASRLLPDERKAAGGIADQRRALRQKSRASPSGRSALPGRQSTSGYLRVVVKPPNQRAKAAGQPVCR